MASWLIGSFIDSVGPSWLRTAAPAMSLGGCDWAFSALGVGPDDDTEAIRRAYRRLALKLHPDRNHQASCEQFQRLAEAWEAVQAARLTGLGANERVLSERVSLGAFERRGELFVLPCRCGDSYEVPIAASAYSLFAHNPL